MIGSMEVVYPKAFWNDQDPAYAWPPYVAGWYKPETVDGIPDKNVGWLLAQGWKITNAVDDPNNPPGKLYSLSKDALQSKVALNDLVNRYIDAYNEARGANDQRYDDIVCMYNDTLLKTHAHLNRAAAANNSYETLFITSLSSVTQQVDWYLASLKSGAVDTFDRASDSLNVFATTLSRLGTGYDAYKAQVEAILTDQAADLSGFTAKTAALLTQLDADFTTLDTAIADMEATAEATAEAHIVTYEAKLNELDADLATVETQLLALVDEAEAAYTEYQTQGLSILDGCNAELATLESAITSQLSALDSAVATLEPTSGSQSEEPPSNQAAQNNSLATASSDEFRELYHAVFSGDSLEDSSNPGETTTSQRNVCGIDGGRDAGSETTAITSNPVPELFFDRLLTKQDGTLRTASSQSRNDNLVEATQSEEVEISDISTTEPNRLQETTASIAAPSGKQAKVGQDVMSIPNRQVETAVFAVATQEETTGHQTHELFASLAAQEGAAVAANQDTVCELNPQLSSESSAVNATSFTNPSTIAADAAPEEESKVIADPDPENTGNACPVPGFSLD